MPSIVNGIATEMVRNHGNIEALYRELGMNLTTAINVFLRQSLRVGGLPFDVTVNTPNAVTIAAMREAEQLTRDASAKRYTDVEQALRELRR